MPVIECDTERARERLEAAGVTIEAGNTDHERWRARHENATAVAYDGKVVIQGSEPVRLEGVIRETGGRAHCYFDGASRGNPGPAAIGWVVVNSTGIVSEGGERIDDTTNNRAEYEALVRVLEIAHDFGYSTVELRGDSQLVVEQVRGAWQTNNPALRERRVRVRELLTNFEEWSLEHVPREANERSDRLANEAFDD